jgi:hypothetical protein
MSENESFKKDFEELVNIAVSDIWKVAEKSIAPTFAEFPGGPSLPITAYVVGEPLCPVAYAITDYAEAQIDAYNTMRAMVGLEPTVLPPCPHNIWEAFSPQMQEHYKLKE